ncbi:MAG: glycoside hydrolase family 9 protein [Spirochaetia bacterium]
MTDPRIHVNQVGYLCASRKRIVVPADAAVGAPEFHIQDMGRTDAQAFGSSESWKPVFRGKLAPHSGPMGKYLVGDFSAVDRPGIYRAVLPPPASAGGTDVSAWSYPFTVADGVFSRLPPLFLDFVHGQRCGDFEDELRGPCHLDDAVRSDTGAQIDVVGGWHDAGDLRKWMATSPLPILGFFALRNRLGFSRNIWRERPHEDDLLAEAAWGIRWILKMQDPDTGMFYEDVAGGGDSRRAPGMAWWYENHAGCCADNAGNFFSDNRRASGDERAVRAQYHPIAQYIAITILLDAVDYFHAHYPALSRLCRDAALRCWEFMKSRRRDDFHAWTSVIAWRLLAGLRLHAMGIAPESEIAALVSVLLDLQSPEHGFWFMDSGRREPYRGIVNSAQPIIALAAFIESDYEHSFVGQVRDALDRCRERFVLPMLATNPFGMMPYGLFSGRRTEGDAYHDWQAGLVYRFYMPDHAPERVNHGLSCHWTSWAHGLAAMGRVLDNAGCRDAALDQLGWLMGNNPLNACMITGVGCSNASPYSRYYGTLPGGFCVGPRGTADDCIYVDMTGRTEWNSGEYWLAPLANALLALADLLPSRVLLSGKLG